MPLAPVGGPGARSREPSGAHRLVVRTVFVAAALAVAVAVAMARPPPAAAQVPLRGGVDAPCGMGTTLTGTVVERRTRLGLPNAIVRAEVVDEEGEALVRFARTGPEGGFQFCNLTDGLRLSLRPSWDGNEGRTRMIDAGSGTGALVLEVDLGEPTFLAITVRDAETGEPVPNATVLLEPLDLGGISNEQGRLIASEVPPGQYTLRAHHIAYAGFSDRVTVDELGAEEFEVLLRPTAIAVEPIEVRITGRDPVLVGQGFYDRMAALEEGDFYDYWDVEPYALLSTFIQFKAINRCTEATPCVYYINGRPWNRSVYRATPGLRGAPEDPGRVSTFDEPSFGNLRGVEIIRCRDLPPDMMHRLESLTLDCWAVLVWEGGRRVRSERDPPEDGLSVMEREGRIEKKDPDGDGG